MNLFFVLRVLRSFILILKVIKSFKHFGEFLNFHLVFSFDLNRLFLVWLVDGLVSRCLELFVPFGDLGDFSFYQADVLRQLFHLFRHFFSCWFRNGTFYSFLSRFFSRLFGRWFDLESISDGISWVGSRSLYRRLLSRLLRNRFRGLLSLSCWLSNLLIILILRFLILCFFLCRFLLWFLLYFAVLLSDFKALLKSVFFLVIRIIAPNLVPSLHVLVLLVGDGFIIVIRMSFSVVSCAIHFFLANILNTFLLWEVVLVSELLHQPVAILIASISPHLVGWAAVLELLSPSLFPLVGDPLLPFPLEFPPVVVSLPVVHLSELDFSAPLVSDVPALLGRFDLVGHAVDLVVYFLQGVFDQRALLLEILLLFVQLVCLLLNWWRFL